MPATSRTWLSTRSMLAAWSPLLQAGAPLGDRRLERLRLLQTAFRRGKLQDVHIFFSQPILRWPCLIRSGPEVAAAVEPAGAAVEVVAAAGAVGRGEVAQAAEAPVGAVRVAPAEEPAAAEGVAQVEAPAAVRVVAPRLTTALHHTTSRGQSCRHSHLLLRPISRS